MLYIPSLRAKQPFVRLISDMCANPVYIRHTAVYDALKGYAS